MDEFDRTRAIGERNVAEDLRRGRGVRAIIVSTSGLSGRRSRRARGGGFFVRADLLWVEVGTGGRALSDREGVCGCERERPEGGDLGVLGRRGRGALPNTALANVGLVGDKISATSGSDMAGESRRADEESRAGEPEESKGCRRRRRRRKGERSIALGQLRACTGNYGTGSHKRI